MVLDIKGNGDGNSYLYLDDLNITSVAYHYPSGCNTAPIANNEGYIATKTGTYTSNFSVLDNDQDYDKESVTASIATQSKDGTVSLKADGMFTFTPNANFTGSYTTFTYKVLDNGYNPLYSNEATVRIDFTSETVTLPVTLLNFDGSLEKDKTALQWAVAKNETVRHFAVEKSTDGKSFTTVAIVFSSERKGGVDYRFGSDQLENKAWYRLKIYDRQLSYHYSNAILLQKDDAAEASKLILLQNPVQEAIPFTYTATETGTGMVVIYSLTGIQIATVPFTFQKGNTMKRLTLDRNILPGVYILEVTRGNSRSTAKFVKQ